MTIEVHRFLNSFLAS